MSTRYADETQVSTVWVELIEKVRDILRTMRTAGKFPGIGDDEHIEIRKLPIVRRRDLDDHTAGIFVCPAPEVRFDRLSTNANAGVKLGVLITAWQAGDGDNFDDIGRVLHWRRQMWIPGNGLHRSRLSLASTNMAGEIEAGPVFDQGAWAEGIDQTTVMLRAWTRTSTV